MKFSVFLILKAFSSGCTALTGVEAISNGIPVFQVPCQRNAKITLSWMAFILGSLFFSITVLCRIYNIVPSSRETMVSLLAHAIYGKNIFYYMTQGGMTLILMLAANTSYADFPRLASLLAKDRFLPRQMARIGDRLVFSNGIIGLSLAAILLLVLFQCNTHLLIPLYAIGVFLSFTLSQAGMVLYHFRRHQVGWLKACLVNGLGFLTTGLILIVVVSTKLMGGAWVILIAIPVLVSIFNQIHTHYLRVGSELSLVGKVPPPKLLPVRHTVVIPVSGMHCGILEAIQYALSLSTDVRACYVEFDAMTTERMELEWKKWVHEIPLIILRSPYRSIIAPLLEYFDEVEKTIPGDVLTIVIPEFITAKWYHQILHNQTAFRIRTALLFKNRKVVTSVRYHLKQ